MRVIIATGGSGGHIYPALALADEIMKNKDNKILFVGSNKKMEHTVIPELGYDFFGMEVQGMNGNIFDKLTSAAKIGASYFKCRKLIRDFKPDLVIGFGNYISVPITLAASSLKVPTMLHEQNSYAGKANKFLASKVDLVVGCYEENIKDFGNAKTKILGNPRASQAKNTIKDKSVLNTFDLNPEMKTIVCFMGSLGSETVNKVLEEAGETLDNKEYQTIIVTGKKHFDTFAYKGGKNVKVVPYIDGLKVMAACDACVIRAGATTAAEITVLGLPSIMIPSPYVPNNHQYYNALALANKNASILLEEKDLSVASLIDKMDLLMNNDELRNEMSKNAMLLGTPNASEDILKEIEGLIA